MSRSVPPRSSRSSSWSLSSPSSSSLPTTRWSPCVSASTRRGPTSRSILKQRHDQLPALVSAVRGLMRFEAGVLEDVAAARAAYRPTAPIPAQAATSATTTTAVQYLLATVEAYPDLQSHANVLALQSEISRLEIDARGPPRALQRPGLPLQHPDPDLADPAAGLDPRLAHAPVLRGRARRRHRTDTRLAG